MVVWLTTVVLTLSGTYVSVPGRKCTVLENEHLPVLPLRISKNVFSLTVQESYTKVSPLSTLSSRLQ